MKIKLIFLLLLVQLTVNAKEIKFGKVSKEEVAETQHSIYPEANAAILYKNEWVHYEYQYDTGWNLIREVHYRIKIYNKEGFDWATLQVPLYTGRDGREDIYGIKGYTFNIDNGKLVSKKLKRESVFEENVNKYQNKVSIAMPEVKEGSVLDIEYIIMSPLFWYIDEFKFQYDIPIDQAEARVEIPEYFIFKQYSRGFHSIEFNQSRKNRSINVSYRSSDEIGRLGKTSRKNGTLSFVENIYTMRVANVPPLLDEKYTSNIDNYMASMSFELASTRFPDQPYKNYSLTWEDVAKFIYNYDDFGGELSKYGYFDDDIDQLISDLSSDWEKAMAIFQYVKSKMTWDNYTGVTCSSQGVRKAYKEGKGNVAEINLMLTAMFKYAGLDANPVLVSTRSNGIPLFPTSDGFNYVISGLKIQNDLVLFDATEKNAFPDILPIRALNWIGRLVREDGSSSQVDLVPKTKSIDAVTMSVELNDDGSIQGKYRQQYSANHAFLFRNDYNGKSRDSYLDDLEKRYGDIEISEFNLQNVEDLSKPIVQSFAFVKEAAYEEISGKLYLSPMFHLATRTNPFKTEKREFPIDYGYPWKDMYIINIKIPEGYAVESVPEPIAVALPEKIGNFKYNVSVVNNMISARIEVQLNSPVVSPNYYLDLKEFYNLIIKKESEKVILTKL